MEFSLNSSFTSLSYNDLFEIDGGLTKTQLDIGVATVCFVAGVVGVFCPVVGIAATCCGYTYALTRALGN